MKYVRTMGAAILVAAAFFAGHAVSQERPGSATDGGQWSEVDPEQMQEMMQAWIEMSAPGEPHAEMAKAAGIWETTMRVWMQGPDGPVTESTGEAKFEMFGDRWLLQRQRGEMMGMPVRGIGITGYDNFKQKYVSMWVDSMSTAMSTSEGWMHPSGDVLTMWGKMDEPMLGLRDMTVKYVTRFIDDDTHIFEIHDFNYPEGKTKVVEIEYRRKK
jgi:hypothetical protein